MTMIMTMIRSLGCWLSGGHQEWTYYKVGGIIYAPPCVECGRPNSNLEWAHKYREVYARAPREDEWRS